MLASTVTAALVSNSTWLTYDHYLGKLHVLIIKLFGQMAFGQVVRHRPNGRVSQLHDRPAGELAWGIDIVKQNGDQFSTDAAMFIREL